MIRVGGAAIDSIINYGFLQKDVLK